MSPSAKGGAPPDGSDEERARRNIRVVLAVTVFFWASIFVYAAVLPVYAESLGASLTLVGIIVGSYGATQSVLRLPVGMAADRWRCRHQLVRVGLVACGLGPLILALVPSPELLILGRAVTGMGGSCWVALLVVAVSAYPGDQIAGAMSAITVAATLAEAGAVLAGGLLADAVGWTAPFYVAAALALAGLVSARRLPPEAVSEGVPATWGQVFRAATRPQLLQVSGVTALVTFAIYATTYGFLPVLAQGMGASRTEIGVLATLSQLGFAGGALLAGAAVRWLSAPRLVAIGASLVGLSVVLIPRLSGLLLLDLSQLVGGFGRGLVNPLAAALTVTVVAESERATALGVYQALWSVGILLGPPLAGWIAERHGLSAAFATGAAAAAIAALLALGIRPHRKV